MTENRDFYQKCLKKINKIYIINNFKVRGVIETPLSHHFRVRGVIAVLQNILTSILKAFWYKMDDKFIEFHDFFEHSHRHDNFY